MRAKDLIEDDAQLWRAATHHAFLGAFWEMAYARGDV